MDSVAVAARACTSYGLRAFSSSAFHLAASALDWSPRPFGSRPALRSAAQKSWYEVGARARLTIAVRSTELVASAADFSGMGVGLRECSDE